MVTGRWRGRLIGNRPARRFRFGPVWVAWYAGGAGAAVARGVRAALMAVGAAGLALALVRTPPVDHPVDAVARTWGPRLPGGPPPAGPASPERAESALAGWVIAVDPGHGGADGGVRHGDMVEKDVNLAVARHLQALLERAGARVVMTRTGDDEPLLSPRAALERRLARAVQGEAAVYVSIHANSYPDPSQFGAQAFYHPASAESRRLALLIQEELVRIHPENYREALGADFFVLRHAGTPAVLVEVGFLSNPQDRERLRRDDWQQSLAAAIVRGLERFVLRERPPAHRPAAGVLGPPPGFIQAIYPDELR